jgi:hypothetical protein
MNTKRPMSFEIPIMLNPGEFLCVNNTSQFSTDGHLDLHLQAIVEAEDKNQTDKSCQTDKYIQGGNSSQMMKNCVLE